MNIEKKIWPKYFERILNGEKTFELRLADFNIDVGDNLILRDYNPEKEKYTGRFMIRKVLNVAKFNFEDIENLEIFNGIYNLEQLKKFGVYLINI